MAIENEKLTVRLEAATKAYENAMARALGQTQKQLSQAERSLASFRKAQQAAFAKIQVSNLGNQIKTALAGAGVAVSANEVLAYADAWNTAKNALAVAGITGAQQAQVLERLYNISQAQSAPLSDMVKLYGGLAQVQGGLGVTSDDLAKATEGIGLALRVSGSSAQAAGGALTQLTQLLGAGTVRAEEFNSVNEGLRPLLIAVANGSDRFGGSVAKLRNAVIDGTVSSQEFFQAFLKGLPVLQKMSANALPTIEQGVTKVGNAFMKYVGSTDESLGASQRLAQGLNALADDFDNIADTTLKVAAIIAGALAGRAIGAMVVSLGMGAASLIKFAGALRTAGVAAAGASALANLSALGGPIGLAIGVTAATGLLIFSDYAKSATDDASDFEKSLRDLNATAEISNTKLSSLGRDAEVAITSGSNADKLAQARGLFKSQIEEFRKAAQEEVGRYDNQVIAQVGESLLGRARQEFNGYLMALEQKAITLEQFQAKMQELAVSNPQVNAVIDASRTTQALDAIIDKFASGEMSAAEFQTALAALDDANPDFSAIVNKLSSLGVNAAKTSEFIRRLKSDIDALAVTVTPAVPSIGQVKSEDAQVMKQLEQSSAEYTANARETLSLSERERDVQIEIARIKSEAARKNGTIVLEADARALAVDTVAQREAESKRGGGGSTQTFAQVQADFVTQAKETQALVQAYGMLTTSGSAAEVQLKLIQAALLSGAPLTDKMKASIEKLALATGQAADQYKAMQQSAEELQQFQQNIASSFEQAFLSIVDGSQSAADAFKNMARTILAEFVRMQVKAALFGNGTSTGGGLLSGLLGGGGFLSGLFGRATGGRVNAGQAYTVGESGREMFVPDRAGRIIPAKALRGGGSGSASVKVINQVSGANVSAQTKRGRGGQPEIEILVSEMGKRIAEGSFDKQFRSRFGVGPRVVER